jgi:hypothetical protein
MTANDTPPGTRVQFVEQRHDGRRNGDLNGLFANKWARWLGMLLLPVLGGAVNELKNWYLSVPSVGWQSSVSKNMEEEQKLRVEFIQLSVQVAGMRSDIDDNAVRANADRAEINAKLNTLNEALQRWFVKASSARVVR